MTPEFGATAAMFYIDDKTIDYLRLTGRDEEQIALVENYAKTLAYGAIRLKTRNTSVYLHLIYQALAAILRGLLIHIVVYQPAI